MTKKSDTEDKKIITLSIQEIITYAVFLITFGASVFTFFQAIPELNKLKEQTNSLDKNLAVSVAKIDMIISQLNESKKNK